ncbi:MAG: Grx4 family monothiol glutaredoxin [Kordiimonadaceae bacterium]|jgi:monothiol glutaredoxin|nr:Grx4 family monothiol glutaredoxin [Kordiimonadaceae bacterium]MBT6036877.1 Grx4 family monothiol glutaredoxin [Kordiimonadaceae bacterium]MBT6328199.1 Grx4 family monothiol glutaredoxin [Kordiimonadaceae bacterium]MBT7583724.1 Grx4 family monothiol glutaredoxin [Kordiimonadaceae bacterium]
MTNPVHDRIKNDVTSNDVVLYMKGDAMFPQCGFSATVIEILNYFNVPYETHNVLQDEALRDGIKEYSDWPTIPQLYVKGEFLGGCDIIREMAANGELVAHFESVGIEPKG